MREKMNEREVHIKVKSRMNNKIRSLGEIRSEPLVNIELPICAVEERVCVFQSNLLLD